MIAVDRERALGHLMDLLAIEGLSGHEGRVAEAVRRKLVAAGCRERWLRHDRAHRKIGNGFEIGNLILQVPGRGPSKKEPRRLFMGHLDTVPLCRGAVPIRRDGRIVARGDTALGGDNRTAIGALVTLVETLEREQLAHPPITVLMTVGEEIGLLGARHVEVGDLGTPAFGFNVDGGEPANLVVGAIGADRWEAHVRGLSSHAGVHPEDGISATLIASRAIAGVAALGYFGKVEKGRRTGTSNVGIVRGGEATNQVTDYVWVKGEARSHSKAFLAQITGAYRQAFERAARATKNSSGASGRVEFQANREYQAFRMSARSQPVRLARSAARRLGLEPKLRISNGGLDANNLNAKGVPTVTLGAGQHSPHTVDEYVEIAEYLSGCQLLLEIATAS